MNKNITSASSLQKFLKFFVLLFAILYSLFASHCFSQGIGINNSNSPPNSDALLDIDANGMNPKAGLLIPRMTNAERDLIKSPIPESLLIYNTDIHCFQAYYNGSWIAFGCIGSNCQLPDAPTAVTNTASQTQIVWNWTNVSGATGYQWNTTSLYPGIGVNMVYGNTYTQTNLTCNTSYTLNVWANNSCGNSATTTLTQMTSPCVYVCGQDGTFIDARDGQTYGYVVIGSQTWMCQNLNYGTMIGTKLADNITVQNQTGTAALPTPEKYCYSYVKQGDATQISLGTANCNIYGGLYQWAEAMQYKNNCTNTTLQQPTLPVQGICPTGWHIPSHDEWTLLELTICTSASCSSDFPYDITTAGARGTNEGNMLKETGNFHWSSPSAGNNSSGFSALPGSYCWAGLFGNIGDAGAWWSAKESGATFVWYRTLYSYDTNVVRSAGYKANGFSVRCIKD